MARSAAILVLALLLCISLVRPQEVEDESEFTYVEGDERGPEHWGELHQNWSACGKGQNQSPIDIVTQDARVYPDLGRLRRIYHPANATLLNRGHDIMIKWSTGGGSIEIEGKRYRLNQGHWHTPAEHTVNGRRYPLELHLVHESEDGEIAVVSILYTYGRPDTFLAELREEIASIADKQPPEKAVGLINAKHIKIGSRKYYRYIGSLTTPPCTEGVIWNIVHKVRTVSQEQVRALHVAIHD
ncbi:hypothetical protein KI387_012630, partial [Taxus chinensis]